MIVKLLLLFVISFIQNMAFTFVSRSRNSGNPERHFYAALGSNSIWFVCNYFILFPEILRLANDPNLWLKLAVMIVYVIATALGSVVMMKINLGHWNIPFFTEKGKDEVGKR